MTFVYPRQCLQLKGQWGPGKWFTQSSNKHSWFQNPYWQKTKELAISTRGQGDELGANETRVQLAVRTNLNSGSLNCKSSTLTNPLTTYMSQRSQQYSTAKTAVLIVFFYVKKSYLNDFAVMLYFAQFVDKESYNEVSFSRNLLKT